MMLSWKPSPFTMFATGALSCVVLCVVVFRRGMRSHSGRCKDGVNECDDDELFALHPCHFSDNRPCGSKSQREACAESALYPNGTLKDERVFGGISFEERKNALQLSRSILQRCRKVMLNDGSSNGGASKSRRGPKSQRLNVGQRGRVSRTGGCGSSAAPARWSKSGLMRPLSDAVEDVESGTSSGYSDVSLSYHIAVEFEVSLRDRILHLGAELLKSGVDFAQCVDRLGAEPKAEQRKALESLTPMLLLIEEYLDVSIEREKLRCRRMVLHHENEAGPDLAGVPALEADIVNARGAVGETPLSDAKLQLAIQMAVQSAAFGEAANAIRELGAAMEKERVSDAEVGNAVLFPQMGSSQVALKSDYEKRRALLFDGGRGGSVLPAVRGIGELKPGRALSENATDDDNDDDVGGGNASFGAKHWHPQRPYDRSWGGPSALGDYFSSAYERAAFRSKGGRWMGPGDTGADETMDFDSELPSEDYYDDLYMDEMDEEDDEDEVDGPIKVHFEEEILRQLRYIQSRIELASAEDALRKLRNNGDDSVGETDEIRNSKSVGVDGKRPPPLTKVTTATTAAKTDGEEWLDDDGNDDDWVDVDSDDESWLDDDDDVK